MSEKVTCRPLNPAAGGGRSRLRVSILAVVCLAAGFELFGKRDGLAQVPKVIILQRPSCSHPVPARSCMESREAAADKSGAFVLNARATI